MDLWTFLFSQFVAWTFHPGYSREGTKVPSLEDCARKADECVALLARRSG